MNLLVLLVVIGVVMALVPMDARIKNIIYVVVVILAIVLVLELLGLGGPLPRVRIG